MNFLSVHIFVAQFFELVEISSFMESRCWDHVGSDYHGWSVIWWVEHGWCREWAGGQSAQTSENPRCVPRGYKDDSSSQLPVQVECFRIKHEGRWLSSVVSALLIPVPDCILHLNINRLENNLAKDSTNQDPLHITARATNHASKLINFQLLL